MSMRILIVDDEPRWIQFAKNDLSRFEVDVAPNVEIALDKMDKTHFELVIASSKNLDALGIIAKRQEEKRVVVTTVMPNSQEALNAYRMGALRYFPKSFRQKDLLNRIQEVIHGLPNTQPANGAMQ